MPIKRLQRATASFPHIGKLRKGGEKSSNAPGKDLEYFRFDSKDMLANEKFQQAYGNQPDTINIYLPFVTTDENFDVWQEAYLAGGLQHRCDGETCTIWLDPNTGKYNQEPKPCPGGCKEVGRLNVIIPALERFAYVTVETHSVNDIITLTDNLNAVESMAGTLQGIPFVLKRRPRTISTPGKGGKRVSRVFSLLSIEVDPVWASLRLDAMQRGALEMAGSAGLITDSNYVVIEEQKRIGSARAIDAETGEIIDASDVDIEIDMADVEEIDPSPSAGTLKDDERMRKQFHAVGLETYGEEWNDKRYELVKAVAPMANSSNELTINQAQRLIDGMRNAQ